MPINTRELLNAVSILTDERNMRVTLKESVKAGCITGASTIVGGILMGPPGIAIGGILGACSAAYMSRGKFKPVSHVILYDLSLRQQEQLAVSLQRVVSDFRVDDVAILLPLLLTNSSCQAAILKQVVLFLQSEMNMQIID